MLLDLSTMAIQKHFVLRYREDGHLRFQIPPQACQPQVATLISTQIASIQGVNSVKLFRSQQKLAIRYQSAVCSFGDLAKQLFEVLAELEKQGCFSEQFAIASAKKAHGGLKQRLKNSRINHWFSRKMAAAKETAQAAKIIGKLSSKGPKALFKDPEKATIDFLNDILVLYLIKTHWTRITQQWLIKPFVHRYEWLAVFYLFFLLVRSRRPK